MHELDKTVEADRISSVSYRLNGSLRSRKASIFDHSHDLANDTRKRLHIVSEEYCP